MFSNCNNLQELNRKRMEAIKAGEDSRLINSMYNARRKEIMVCDRPYNSIVIHRAKTEDIQPVMYLPYVGQASKKNTIEITNQGIKC